MNRPIVYFEVTIALPIAYDESAIRFRTPVLRNSFEMWDLTVRTSIPKGIAISLFELPATNISSTFFSRAVRTTGAAGKAHPSHRFVRSMNIFRMRLETHSDPWLTIRIACANSVAEAASSI